MISTGNLDEESKLAVTPLFVVDNLYLIGFDLPIWFGWLILAWFVCDGQMLALYSGHTGRFSLL